jgi:hypothetical protein
LSPPRRLAAALALTLPCWWAGADAALADTLSLSEYRARLLGARTDIAAGRVEEARQALQRTEAVRVGNQLVRVDDGPLARRLGSSPGAVEAALADLDIRITLADRAAREVDAEAADARLRALLAQRGGQSDASFLALFIAILGRIYDALGRPSPLLLIPAQILIGVALGAVVVAILVRGARERIRLETVLPEARAQRGGDPAARLREAEAARARGDLRGAIRGYYLFALEALAAREALAYDPALTDRELLARAAGLPHVEALRELVGLHERVWYGLRPPAPREEDRARVLAQRVAA